MDRGADQSPKIQAIPPAPHERFPAVQVDAPHPATIDPDELLKRCELRTQRRSGPGGQHRNKTSSGVFLTLLQHGIVGEATERRSQQQNRVVALSRLRFRLAIGLRSPSIFDTPAQLAEAQLRDQFRGSRLRINEENVIKPAVLALILNDLHAAGGQPSLVAGAWSMSTSAIVAFLSSHAPALVYVNEIRNFHARGTLKA